LIGALNPCPFRVGGGPTPSSRAYTVIRDAVGEGGSAPNDRGIDGLWRRSRAKGLAAATSSTRRALLQAFPHLATDLLPYYERILGIAPPTGATEPQRVDEVVERWTRVAIRSTPELEAALQVIDPRLSLLHPTDATSITTQGGRVFEAHDSTDEGPAFALPGGLSQLPNFSTRHVVSVRFTLGYDGVPNLADQRVIERARELLRTALGSDTDFTISTGPLVLGVTPLGLGAL
jgi:hypothetical protein